jgi:phosphoribosylformylglycinamidine synthase
VVLGIVAGAPPAVELTAEVALQGFLVAAAGETLLSSAHDCGDGGLAVTLAECAIGSGHGVAVTLASDLPTHVALFSESAARVVVSVDPTGEDRLVQLAGDHGVPLLRLGETGGPRAVVDGHLDLTVAELTDAWEGAFPRLLGERA